MKDIRSSVLPQNYIGLIQESEFTDSLYVWAFIQRPDGGQTVVVPRSDIALNDHTSTILSPAPILDEILADLAGWAKGRDCSGYFAVEVDVNNYYRVSIENGSVSWTNVEWIFTVPGDKQVLLQEMAQFSYSELRDALNYLKTGFTI